MYPLRRLARPDRDRSHLLRVRAVDALATAGWIAERPDSERDPRPVARALADAVVNAYLALDALGGDTRAALDEAVRRQPRRPRGRADRKPTPTLVPIDSSDWLSGRATLGFSPTGVLYARTPHGVIVLGRPLNEPGPGPNDYCDGEHLSGPHNDNLRTGREPGGITVTDDTHRPPDVQEASQALPVVEPGTVGCG
jgi:hypothetical protein